MSKVNRFNFNFGHKCMIGRLMRNGLIDDKIGTLEKKIYMKNNSN